MFGKFFVYSVASLVIGDGGSVYIGWRGYWVVYCSSPFSVNGLAEKVTSESVLFMFNHL